MLAHEVVHRKIIARISNVRKGETTKFYVQDMSVEGEVAYFELYDLNNRKVKVKVSDLTEWGFNDIEEEGRARRIHEAIRMYNRAGEDIDKEHKLFKPMYEAFEDAKKKLADKRREGANKGRMYYHDGKLSVYYDIYHGNTVHRFLSLEEIEELKASFLKKDFMRAYQPLMNLQAFDKNGVLVLDEWYDNIEEEM
jgi:hypothetical protein